MPFADLQVNEVGYISAAYILENYQRTGIVKKLEENLVQFFRTLEIEYVEVNFMIKNTSAKKCWEALDYKIFRAQARKKIQ